MYQRHVKRLNHFNLSCLRKLLKSSGKREVQKKAGMQSMHTVLKLTQLRWTGHVIRMRDERPPKKESILWITTEEVAKRNATKTPSDFDIPMGSWE